MDGRADQKVRDRCWLLAAIEQSKRCTPSASAFSVGAVVIDTDDNILATGYSRDVDALAHAEESALAKLDATPRQIQGATIYSSLEPCSVRKSRPRSCADLILAAGIMRVVFAMREPSHFVDCHGAEILQRAGVEVVEMPDLAQEVALVNRHLL